MVTVLLIVIGFLLCALIVVANIAVQSQKPGAKPFTADFSSWLPKPEPQPPKDYAQTSIPRTRGPWRRQMQDLQARHNSKQIERDRLIPKENHAKTR